MRYRRLTTVCKLRMTLLAFPVAGAAALMPLTSQADGIGDDASYPYAFNAAMSSDLTNPSAWSCNEVPTADKDVLIRGAGVVNFTAESTRFASITVKDGATEPKE